MYLRIETFKLTVPENLQNSASVAQHPLPEEKTTDVQSVLPTLVFNTLSPSTGACFSPALACRAVVSTYQDMRVSHCFSQEVQSEHFAGALPVSPVLAAAKSNWQGEKSFLPP